MRECEICLVGDADVTFTVEAARQNVDVHVCRECATAVFGAMAQRYNAAIEENNRVVDELVRWFKGEAVDG